ncbi:MAG: YraN family protein [Oscillospiraceae bacterium]
MNTTHFIGRWGEAVAADFLRHRGYKIIGMSYKTRFGEIDIIAENRKFLVFAEVKTRKNDNFAEAREFVDAGKQHHILSAAKLWLSLNECSKQPRFDVIEIYAPEGAETKKPKINHIENAFFSYD